MDANGDRRADPPEAATAARAAPRPQILEATDGGWLDMPPPDVQPQFRCILRERGSVVGRGVAHGPQRSS